MHISAHLVFDLIYFPPNYMHILTFFKSLTLRTKASQEILKFTEVI